MCTMTIEQLRYLAYLLRLWGVDVNGEVVWRASLEDSHTGERRGFADLDRLFEFLVGQTQEFHRCRTDEVDSYPRSTHLHKDE
jgi:hypothetical protein